MPSIFLELRRRSVFRVAASYVVVSWLILQVVSVLKAPLNLPDWFETVVVVFLAIGFVVALFIAWAFELTPDGIRPTRLSNTAAAYRGSKLDYALVGGLVLVVVVTLWGRIPLPPDTEPLPMTQDLADRSIGVLPFADMSPEGNQEYFGDGIAEELLNELVRLDGLRVASRTSSFSFKNVTIDVTEIAETLNVSSILEGSIRKDGNRVRITAQLINAADGYQLWSETYDRELTDIFAVQEDIASAVAGALGVTLGVGGVNAFRGAGTRNVEAYEIYLEGLGLGPTPDAIPFFQRATELDPNYAAAWAQLGLRTSATQFLVAPEEGPAIRERGLGYVQRAVDLDSDSAQAMSLLGSMLYSSRRWIEGEEAHLAALSMLRTRGNLIQYGNLLARSGRSSAAIGRFDAARELNAPSFRPSVNTWAVYLALGRLDEAREAVDFRASDSVSADRLSIALSAGDEDEIRSLLAAMPPAAIATAMLYTPMLVELNAPEPALAVLRAVHEDQTAFWPSKGHDIAMLAAYLGDPELALEAFGEELRYTGVRAPGLWYPHMSEVRRLPAFKELMADINLVDFWRASGWADACQPLGNDDFNCN